jgi:biotin synthase
MTAEEVIDCVQAAVRFEYGTVVLQSGEDPGITAPWVSDVIRRIKKETALAVTLSLGERTFEELAAWREAGADRYLLRFETSNPVLFRAIHPAPPGRPPVDRLALLDELHRLGYEAGSGVMIGIPGQTYRDLAEDIALFSRLGLEMIGVGPYIPHPGTPLASIGAAPGSGPEAQVPNTELMTYKTLALTRLACPTANIPSTTALATLNLDEGRELGLQRGANVVMPNLTPPKYRMLYEIYPAKACIRETADQCNSCLRRRIESIGRKIGKGPGSARR